MKFLFGVFFTVIIVLLFNYTHIAALKLYPVLVNLLVFSLFFCSLFRKETVIQFFARKMEGHELPEISKRYTRNLTYVWCGYLFFNFCVALFSCFCSDFFWSLYNGFLSYFLTGSLFIIEYIVRIRFKRKNNV